MSRAGELRQQVDDLALRLVVGDAETDSSLPGWISALELFRNCAMRQQAGEAARIAEAVLRAVAVEGNAAARAMELQEGITRLQQAIGNGNDEAATRGRRLAENGSLSPAQDPELVLDFIVESREHLARMEGLLLAIERDPKDSEALNAIFRGFHTIKGLAGFLDLSEVQSLAHEVETVLDRARNSEWAIDGQAVDVILQAADYLNRWLAHLESLMQNRPSEPPAPDAALKSKIAALGDSAGDPLPEISTDLAALGAAVKASSAEPLADAPHAKRAHHAETMAVKVDTAKLDYLVDMAGEMVIAESLVRHDPELGMLKSPQLQRKISHLTRITSELQRTAMAMRLVPIGPLFRRMARLVRDLSRQFDKRVEMRTEGDDIDLDRTIVEELADPLMHMVRNALDHGIETQEERVRQGKEATAQLLLKARHHAGQVVIEVVDDGRGLNRDAIRAKAIHKGIIRPDKELSDSEIHNLIFEPGFTTAAQVTNVSGRGVGMDVVRRHIDKLRGRIEIHSKPGQGATFLIRLPLTLAIIDGLVVAVGEERYIVPLFSVREMFRPTADTMWTVQKRGEMALVRGSLLPVLRLHRRFRVLTRKENPLEAVLVVAEVEGQRLCVMVDDLIGKQEVVIKSLGETFKNIPGVAGGAILGDGRVGLILDLDRLYRERHGDAIG